ncbi:cytochrome P450 [Stachybotrys elegans]|uniref:Cytochrome P450 n=1 Tax=Stachybotrys elegans TaxID=80388 RepID=A0A8K0SJN0_9HYPO|nr:cytochrome P450 [Stachybotrys elegans]
MNSATSGLWKSVQERNKGYAPIPRVPQLDPFLGLDMAFSQVKSVKTHTFLQWLRSLHIRAKAKTVSFSFLGKRFIHITEPENMKALFSGARWKDFGVEPMRLNRHATMPFAHKGVGTVDGPEWEVSRSLIMPHFTPNVTKNMECVERHTDILMSIIPRDGSTFDLQTLVQRWFLDTSTEFMFGEPVGCLQKPELAEVAWAMTEVLRGLRFRLMAVQWLWLFRHKPWYDAINVVHNYINPLIDKAYNERSKRQAEASSANDQDKQPERTDMLWSMVPHFGGDRKQLRSELLVVFATTNDTTSLLLSNVFWNFARRPDIYQKVREEVLSYGSDAPLTYDCLRSMKYLDAVLNETHRLYPINVTQTRTCVKDSPLPVGGGPDRKAPIMIRKGDVIRVNKATMFRDKDLWGEDAEEFKPERWATISPSWGFMPFGGGPRRCPAQARVTTEASYFIARFARLFKAVENRDDNLAYQPNIRVSPAHMNGVKVSVIPT